MRYSVIIPGKTIPTNIQKCLEEQPARSGFYNWLFAFKGEINTWDNIKDRLHEYDVVQVNMSPADMPVIPEIRRVLTQTNNTHTMLVINNDYVAECWGIWKINPWLYDQVQRMGDMVFSTEEYQVSNMINGTFTMPHPTNTKMLKKIGKDRTKDENSIGFIYHWWSGQTYLPSRTLELAKKHFGVQTTRIYGYNPETDPMHSYRGMMWDDIQELQSFNDYIYHVQKNRLMYDPTMFHTYGRNGVEFACLGIPVVGSDRVFSYRKCFPELTVNPVHGRQALNKIGWALNNPEEVKKILDKAYQEVEYFNYENSVKRFMEALEICKKRGGVKFYEKQ